MKTMVILLVLVAVAQTVSSDKASDAKEWTGYKSRYSKKYDKSEESRRMKIFTDTKHQIEEHNEQYQKKKVTFEMGTNEFSDRSYEEVLRTMTGYQEGVSPRGGLLFKPKLNVTAPAAVDWRSSGAVTPVKHQGQCGSCWAFTATGAMESAYFRKTKKLISMSEQQLLDCSGKYGNHGCGGGWPTAAFKYVKDNRGINEHQHYRYESKVGRCRYNARGALPPLVNFVNLPKGDERQLLNAVANFGPVAVAIDTPPSFFRYKSGVYYDRACSKKLTHAVLVVGYGTENGQDYWLVKNSWGANWGMQGYIKMARNKNNNCNIATEASYPVY